MLQSKAKSFQNAFEGFNNPEFGANEYVILIFLLTVYFSKGTSKNLAISRKSAKHKLNLTSFQVNKAFKNLAKLGYIELALDINKDFITVVFTDKLNEA